MGLGSQVAVLAGFSDHPTRLIRDGFHCFQLQNRIEHDCGVHPLKAIYSFMLCVL